MLMSGNTISSQTYVHTNQLLVKLGDSLNAIYTPSYQKSSSKYKEPSVKSPAQNVFIDFESDVAESEDLKVDNLELGFNTALIFTFWFPFFESSKDEVITLNAFFTQPFTYFDLDKYLIYQVFLI